MNAILNDLLRMLTQYESLALLVSALLTSSAVICVAAAATTALRSRSARSRSVVWRLTMVALLVVGAWRLAPDMPPPMAVMEWQVDLSAPEMLTLSSTVVELPLFVLPEKTLEEVVMGFCDTWFLRAWLGIASVWLLIRLCSVFFGLRALRRRSSDAGLDIRRAGGEAGLPATTHYQIVGDLESPMMTGWRTPVIWLPSEAETWDAFRLQAVMRHEAAHWKRGDWLWQWLAQAALCLWWWQPLVWLSRRQLRVETEHAADDMAVTGAEHAPEYARTLVQIAAGLPSNLKSGFGVTMFGNDGVKHRVQALIRTNRWRGRIGVGALTALAVVAAILAVLAATKVEFKQRAPVFQSVAKLVAGGLTTTGAMNWQEQRQDFYGTIIETIESPEMELRALERVRALNPNLQEHDVEILVSQTKGSAIFSVQARCTDGKYAKIFLDALLDEFIAFRQAIRESAQGRHLNLFLQEVVKQQKVMEDRAAALAAFQKENNLVTLTNANNKTATRLNELATQREAQRNVAAELKLALDNLSAALTARQQEARPVGEFIPTDAEASYLKTKNELFVLDHERKFLLQTRKPDHAEVLALDEKIAKAKFLLQSLAGHITKDMQQRYEAAPRRIAVLDEQYAALEQEALRLGRKLAEHERLKSEAQLAKEMYQKLFERVQTLDLTPHARMDYVAIQERASPATEVVQNGLIPVWRLWADQPKAPMDQKSPPQAQKKGAQLKVAR